jgi:hypothetical protein
MSIEIGELDFDDEGGQEQEEDILAGFDVAEPEQDSIDLNQLQDTLTASEGKDIGRFRSGFNAFAGEFTKGILERIPKFYATARAFQKAVGVVPITARDIEQAEEGINPFDPQNDSFYKFGQEVAEFVEETFPEDDRYQQEFLTSVLPQAFGQIGGSVTAGLATGGAGTLLHGIANLSSLEYEQAIESGASQDEAFKNFLLNVPVGATDAIPVGRFFKRLDTATGGTVKEILSKGFKGGLEEMTQEVFQTFLTNTNASLTYDETRGAFDGVLEAAKAGGFVGLVLNAMGVSTRRFIESPSTSLDQKAEADYAQRSLEKEYNSEGEVKSEVDPITELFGPGVDFIPPGERFIRLPQGLDTNYEDIEAVIRTEDGRIIPQGPIDLGGDLKPIFEDGPNEKARKNVKPARNSYTITTDFENESKFKRAFRSWLRPQGNLTEDQFNAAMSGEANIVAAETKATGLIKQLNSLVGKDIPKELENRMNFVLEGGGPNVEGVDPEVGRILTEARDHIDYLSGLLQENGLISDDLKLTIANNIGTYVHRSYRVNKDPNWPKKALSNPDLINKAILHIKDHPREFGLDRVNDAQAELLVRQLLTSNEFRDQFLYESPDTLGLDLGLLRSRKDIAEPIQKLLGVIEDPSLRYMETIHALATATYRLDSFNKVKNLGEGSMFFHKNQLLRPEGYNTPISLGSTGINPFEDYVTHPEILQSLRNVYDVNTPLSRTWSAVMKFVSAAKIGKTILNPLTHVRNAWGGMMFMTANGHLPGKKNLSIAKALIKNDSESIAKREEWARLGLTGKSIGAREIQDLLRDAKWDGDTETLAGVSTKWLVKTKDIGKKGFNKIVGVYSGVDDAIRISIYEKELARYAKAMGKDKSDPDVQEYAASITNSVVPNYDRVPRVIKLLRRSPILGTFVSFPYEITRTSINMVNLIKSDLKSPNNRIKLIGMQRMFGLTATLAAPVIAASLSKTAFGITDEVEDDIEKLAPPWDNNKPKHYTQKGGGKVSYNNLGYVDPYNILKEPLVEFMEKGDEGKLLQGVVHGFWNYLSNFLAPEIATKALNEAINNRDSNGNDIVNPILGIGEQIAGRVLYLYERAFEPGFAKEVEQYISGDRDEEDLMLMFLGLRETEVDFEESLGFRVRDFDLERRQAKRIANRVIFNPTANFRQKEAAKDKAQAAYDKSFEEMSSLLKSARRLGVPSSQIEEILESQGIGSRVREDLLSGTPSRLTFSQGGN